MSCLQPPENRAFHDVEDTLQRVEQRMAVVAGLPHVNMDPLRVSRCEKDMTPDGQVLANGQYSQRFGIKVVHIFLNDLVDGGEIRFPRLNTQVCARMGCAVVWSVVDAQGQEDLRVVHQGRPPREGTRYCVIGVFRNYAVRAMGDNAPAG